MLPQSVVQRTCGTPASVPRVVHPGHARVDHVGHAKIDHAGHAKIDHAGHDLGLGLAQDSGPWIWSLTPDPGSGL